MGHLYFDLMHRSTSSKKLDQTGFVKAISFNPFQELGRKERITVQMAEKTASTGFTLTDFLQLMVSHRNS